MGANLVRRPIRSLLLLALCWACTLSASAQLTLVGPLALASLKAKHGFPTFSVGAFLFGAAIISLPSALLFRVWGRRIVFLVGCALQVLSGVIGMFSIKYASIMGVLLSCFMAGLAQGLGQFYRFAATEVVKPSQKPFAVTLVLSGGVVSAFAGPLLAVHTSNLFAQLPTFFGSFLAVSVLGFFNGCCAAAVEYGEPAPAADGQDAQAREDRSAGSSRSEPLLTKSNDAESGASANSGAAGSAGAGSRGSETGWSGSRSIWSLMLHPHRALAVAVATCAHTSMTMLMSAMSISMQSDGYDETQTSLAFTAHLVAMFAPGFLTGGLIASRGAYAVSAVGVALFVACCAVLLCGRSVVSYAVGMALCGLAWNMAFSSGTVLISELTKPEDSVRVQGANDFVIFSVAGIGAFPVSGSIVANVGWDWLVIASLVMMLAVCPMLWRVSNASSQAE